MAALGRLLWAYLIKPVAAAILAAAGIEICHYFKFFPERDLAELIVTAPSHFSATLAYLFLIVVICTTLLFAEILVGLCIKGGHKPRPLYRWPWKRRFLILDAARNAFEAAEKLGIERLIAPNTDPQEEKLSWIIGMFLVRKFRLWGKQLPSQNLRIIPEQQLASLRHVVGTNSLRSIFASSAIRYDDVQVNMSDINKYVQMLNRLDKATEADFKGL